MAPLSRWPMGKSSCASAMGKVLLINQRRQENPRLIVGSATNVLDKQTKKPLMASNIAFKNPLSNQLN